jgi:hypothetical protein
VLALLASLALFVPLGWLGWLASQAFRQEFVREAQRP